VEIQEITISNHREIIMGLKEEMIIQVQLMLIKIITIKMSKLIDILIKQSLRVALPGMKSRKYAQRHSNTTSLQSASHLAL